MRKKPGPKPIFGRAMTGAERVRRHRGQSNPVGKAVAGKAQPKQPVKRLKDGFNAKKVREDMLALTSTKLGVKTPEEVDPELWAKSPDLYVRKYGHVPMRTKVEIEQEKFDNGLEYLLAWLKRLPSDVVTAKYLQGWLDASKPRSFRRNKLTKEWSEVTALFERLAVLIGKAD